MCLFNYQLGGDNAWLCPACRRRQHGTIKTLSLWSIPDIVVIHLKRFRQVICQHVCILYINALSPYNRKRTTDHLRHLAVFFRTYSDTWFQKAKAARYSTHKAQEMIFFFFFNFFIYPGSYNLTAGRFSLYTSKQLFLPAIYQHQC